MPQSPDSQPRRGLSYFARNRMANNADTSDHVANENRRPSISKETSRSKAVLTRLRVRSHDRSIIDVCPARRNDSLAAAIGVDEDARR